MTAAPLLDALGRASIEGIVLVLLVALVVRALPRMPAAARCALWWLAGARLLLALVALPWAPALTVTLPERPAVLDRPANVVRAAPGTFARLAPAAVAPAAAVARANVPWSALLVGLWAAGVIAAFAWRLRGAGRLARLWREAIELESPAVRVWLREWLGERRAARAEVRVTADAVTPMALIGTRPRLLLPARALDLDEASLRLVLAHEASHVRRRDLAWSAVPALVECAFWFHPLARRAAAEYVQAREEACDADALRLCDAAPRRYGELLVEFGIEPERHLALAAPFGSSHAHHLKRRISMLASIRALTPIQRLLAAGALALVGAAALFPARLVGADASRASSAEAARAAEASAASTASAAAVGHGASFTSRRARETDTPRELRGFAVGTRLARGVSLSGEFDTRSVRVLDRFQDEVGTPAVLFLIDGTGWVSRDPDVVEQVRVGLDRSRATQGELEAISSQIGRMGSMVGRLSEQQVLLEQQRDGLETRLDRIRDDLATLELPPARAARLQRDAEALESEMATIEAEAEALDEQIRSLDQQLNALESPHEQALARHEAMQRADLQRLRALADRLRREGLLENLGR